MPRPFFERSEATIRATGSMVCVGLDPDPERMPAPLRGRDPERALVPFLEGIVRATRPYAGAYKLQLASYLAYGPAGFRAMERTVRTIGPDRIKILDLKANDVPHTMRLYREGVFRRFGFDAMTASPWVGWDGLETLLDDPTRGVFVVAHTSNPGWADLQSPPRARRPPWREVLRRVRELARRRENVGAVVGATYPRAVAEARRALGPRVPMLLPGIGAQAGDLAASVAAGIDGRGGALWVASSRAILYASAGDDWREASAREAARMRSAITAARRGAGGTRRRPARSRS